MQRPLSIIALKKTLETVETDKTYEIWQYPKYRRKFCKIFMI